MHKLKEVLEQVAGQIIFSSAGEAAAACLGLTPETAGLPVDGRLYRAMEIQSQEATGRGRKEEIQLPSFRKRRLPQLMSFFATELRHFEWRQRRRRDAPSWPQTSTGCLGSSSGIEFGQEPIHLELICTGPSACSTRSDAGNRSVLASPEANSRRFLLSSLYWFTYFSREVHRNLRQYGGLFLLLNADSEIKVADAVGLIEKPVSLLCS